MRKRGRGSGDKAGRTRGFVPLEWVDNVASKSPTIDFKLQNLWTLLWGLCVHYPPLLVRFRRRLPRFESQVHLVRIPVVHCSTSSDNLRQCSPHWSIFLRVYWSAIQRIRCIIAWSGCSAGTSRKIRLLVTMSGVTYNAKGMAQRLRGQHHVSLNPPRSLHRLDVSTVPMLQCLQIPDRLRSRRGTSPILRHNGSVFAL